MEFNKGDVVKLKSGSPAMTVVEPQFNRKPEVQCGYFAGNEYTERVFPAEALTKTDETVGKPLEVFGDIEDDIYYAVELRLYGGMLHSSMLTDKYGEWGDSIAADTKISDLNLVVEGCHESGERDPESVISIRE